MFDYSDPSISVQMCRFQALIEKAHIVIKFPCSYFVQWRTINNRYSITTQTRPKTSHNEVIFNEKLTFYTEMVFNNLKNEYYSKQTFLVLNLVSKSRPDQTKLVGRISIDLAEILNRNRFAEQSQVRLSYCSVEGSLGFGIKVLSKRQSNLDVRDLDRSAFTYDPFNVRDYFSLNPIRRLADNDTATVGKNMRKQPLLLENQQQKKNDRKKLPPSLPYSNGQEVPALKGRSFNGVQGDLHQQNLPSFQKVVGNPQKVNQKQPQQQHQHKEDQIISFRDHNDNESPRSELEDYQQFNKIPSKESSLIERLDERNLESSREKVTHMKKPNRMEHSLGAVSEEYQSGQIKKQRVMTVADATDQQREVFSATKIKEVYESQHFQIDTKGKGGSKTTNGVHINTVNASSRHKMLIHKQSANSSKASDIFSETGEGKLIEIVNRLEGERQQQDKMIESLKELIAKNQQSQKKTSSKEDGQKTSAKIKKIQEEHLQNINQLKKDIAKKQEEIVVLTEKTESQQLMIQSKSIHITELLSKVRHLESQIAELESQIKGLSREKDESSVMVNNQQNIVNSFEKRESKAKLPLPNVVDTVVNQIFQINIKNDNEVYEEQEKDLKIALGKIQELQAQIESLKSSPKQQKTSPDVQQIESSTKIQKMPTVELQTQEGFQITLTKDQNVYEGMEEQNKQFLDRINELEEENAKYRELLQQDQPQTQIHNQPLHPQTTQSFPEPQQQQRAQNQSEQIDSPFKITVTKDKNIYENYQNLEVENTELYERIKQLEDEVESYKEIINSEQQIQHSQNDVIEEGQVEEIFQTSEHQIINDGAEGQSAENPNHEDDDFSSPIFKIILTKGKEVLKEQQNENIELSKRVIELEDEVQRYKQLLAQENTSNKPLNEGMNFVEKFSNQEIFSLEGQNDPQQNDQSPIFRITLTKDKEVLKEQQQENQQLSTKVIQLQEEIQKYRQLLASEPSHKGSSNSQDIMEEAPQIDYEQRFEFEDGQEFRINLVKDKNIYQNQQEEIVALSEKIEEFELLVQRYEKLYGKLDEEPIYRVSVTRDDNVYEEQEREIKELTKMLESQQEELMASATRISILEHELSNVKSSGNLDEPRMVPSRENVMRPNEDIEQMQKMRNTIRELEEKLFEHQIAEEDMKMDTIGNDNIDGFSNKKEIEELNTVIKQLRQNLELVEEEKQLLEEEVGNLQEEKFCMNSTENELKIQIEELNEEIRILKLQNSKVFEENEYYRNAAEGTLQDQELGNQSRAKQIANASQIQAQNNEILIEELKFEIQSKSKILLLTEEKLESQQETIHTLEYRVSTLMQEKEILLGQRQTNLSKIQQLINQIEQLKQESIRLKSEQQILEIKDNTELRQSEPLHRVKINQNETLSIEIEELKGKIEDFEKLMAEKDEKIVAFEKILTEKDDKILALIAENNKEKLEELQRQYEETVLNEERQKNQIITEYESKMQGLLQEVQLLKNSSELIKTEHITQNLQNQSRPTSSTLCTEIITEISSLIRQRQCLSEELLPILSNKSAKDAQVPRERSSDEDLRRSLVQLINKSKTEIMKEKRPYHEKAKLINILKPIEELTVSH